MKVDIPDPVARKLGGNEDSVLLEIALSLYKAERVTLAQAAALVGLHRTRFQEVMCDRGLTLNYSEEDVLQDIRAARKIAAE